MDEMRSTDSLESKDRDSIEKPDIAILRAIIRLVSSKIIDLRDLPGLTPTLMSGGDER